MSGLGNLLQIAGVSLGFGTVVRSLNRYGLGSCHHQRLPMYLGCRKGEVHLQLSFYPVQYGS